jgi:hypothetical protein
VVELLLLGDVLADDGGANDGVDVVHGLADSYK